MSRYVNDARMNVLIQYQEHGMWFTSVVMDGNPSDQSIFLQMQDVKHMYSNKRIRAIDDPSGRLVDMLQ